MNRTAQQLIGQAAIDSARALGVRSESHMIGNLAARLADALNELDGYWVPDVEPGNIHTAFVHHGVHLVAEWERESGEVFFLWDGSSDILPLFGELPDWAQAAIDRDNAEHNADMALHFAGG